MNIRSFKSILLFSIILLIIQSCDSNRIFDENQELESGSWSKDDKRVFSFNIEDTNSFYSVYVNVRNSSNYSYKNLYLFVEMTSPADKFFMDTIEVILADKNGKWTGSGIGNIWQNQVLLLKNVKLLESGLYNLKIQHGMRHENLDAITDIGVRVELAE